MNEFNKYDGAHLSQLEFKTGRYGYHVYAVSAINNQQGANMYDERVTIRDGSCFMITWGSSEHFCCDEWSHCMAYIEHIETGAI